MENVNNVVEEVVVDTTEGVVEALPEVAAKTGMGAGKKAGIAVAVIGTGVLAFFGVKKLVKAIKAKKAAKAEVVVESDDIPTTAE